MPTSAKSSAWRVRRALIRCGLALMMLKAAAVLICAPPLACVPAVRFVVRRGMEYWPDATRGIVMPRRGATEPAKAAGTISVMLMPTVAGAVVAASARRSTGRSKASSGMLRSLAPTAWRNSSSAPSSRLWATPAARKRPIETRARNSARSRASASGPGSTFSRSSASLITAAWKRFSVSLYAVVSRSISARCSSVGVSIFANSASLARRSDCWSFSLSLNFILDFPYKCRPFRRGLAFRPFSFCFRGMTTPA